MSDQIENNFWNNINSQSQSNASPVGYDSDCMNSYVDASGNYPSPAAACSNCVFGAAPPGVGIGTKCPVTYKSNCANFYVDQSGGYSKPELACYSCEASYVGSGTGTMCPSPTYASDCNNAYADPTTSFSSPAAACGNCDSDYSGSGVGIPCTHYSSDCNNAYVDPTGTYPSPADACGNCSTSYQGTGTGIACPLLYASDCTNVYVDNSYVGVSSQAAACSQNNCDYSYTPPSNSAAVAQCANVTSESFKLFGMTDKSAAFAILIVILLAVVGIVAYRHFSGKRVL